MRLIDADELIEAIDPMYVAKKDIVADTFAEGCMQFEKLIKQQPTIFRWIPVSERLPESPCLYTVMCDSPYQIRTYGEPRYWVTTNARHLDMYENIIAWMPLPEPYKESENDD